MKPEKEILIVNWDYKREDLTRHLYKLSDHYELYFLYYYPETLHENRFKVLNWNDYSSAQKLIDTVKPKKIIFHDIESFHQIALNVVAAKNGIETIALEHGLRRGSEVEIEYKKTNAKVALTQSSFKTFLFLFYCMFALQPKFYVDLIKLVYYRKKYGLTVGLHKAQYPLRWAKLYINFTELNASYIRERDGVTPDRFIFTGNPQFDDFFLKAKNLDQVQKEPVIVLFDTPFEDDNTFNMPAEVKLEFYKKLNSYCKKENKKLVVKLHPRSYKRNYNIEDISFMTDVDPAELIFKASGCVFLHLSGLLPFAALYNKVILFNAYPEYNTELTDSSLVNVFDFYGSDINAIVFKDIGAETKNTIINNYFYKTDGKAGERILEAISSVRPK